MVVGKPLMANQPITLIGRGDHHQNFVSEADVAAYTIEAMDNPLSTNQRIRFGGPASYTCTWTEIINEISQVVGSQLPVQYLPQDSQVPLLPDEASFLLNAMETFETYVDMTETAPAFGIKLTTLDEYIRRMYVQPVRA